MASTVNWRPAMVYGQYGGLTGTLFTPYSRSAGGYVYDRAETALSDFALDLANQCFTWLNLK